MIAALARQALLLALVAACSHDAPRENPLDPELTPAVELTAALDDSAGTVALSWTRYDGRQPFGSYRIDRRIRGREEWTSLDSLAQPELTSFADSTLEAATAYEYRVAVINASGFAQPSGIELVPGFAIAPIALFPVDGDGSSGALRLRWTGVRDPRFDQYALIRRERASGADTVVHVTGDRADTTFADTTALHGVTYDYRVQLSRAGQSADSEARSATLALTAVTIAVPAVESTSANVGLRWSTYSGPRFAAYVVRRSSPGLETVSLAALDDRLQVSFVDSSLRGNIQYEYSVRVLTARGETVDSRTARATIHGLAATLALDVDDGDFVRLYREGDVGVTALVAGTRGIRLRPLSRSGWGDEQILLETAVALPRTVSTALLGPHKRLVTTGIGEQLGLLSYDASGDLVLARSAALEGFPLLTEEQVQIAPVVSLTAAGDDVEEVAVERLVIRTAAGEWTEEFDSPLREADWAGIGGDAIVSGGQLRARPATSITGSVARDMVTWADSSSVVEAVEVTGSLTGDEGKLTVQLGSYARGTVVSATLPRAPSVISLTLDQAAGGAVFRWEYNTGRLTERQYHSDTLYVPILSGIAYTLSVGLQDGQPSASVSGPSVAIRTLVAPTWAALSTGPDSVGLLSVNGQHLSVPLLRELDNGPPSGLDASEVRIRGRVISSLTPFELGFCLPNRHQVVTRRLFLRSRDGLVVMSAIGEFRYGRVVGSGIGQMVFPLSFDWREDGNVFVLDAGNARIQAFDSDGGYVTQWGGRGTGEGLFDFGEGNAPEDYFGSIALDADGYVYVAEPLNRRIQVFAP